MTARARVAALAIAAIASLPVMGAGCRRAPPAQRAPFGAACASDAACGAGYCAADHPGGYCEAACRGDVDCGSDGVCVGGGPLSNGDCHRACASTSDCRESEGYRCIARGADASRDYCDPPGRSGVARRLRGGAWRW